jgi:50S ribosomal protein L16 3-hydroxylase
MNAGWELNLDREAFLARHWQTRPLLIAGAVRHFKPPFSRHQLAGLALEDEVESRIIECKEDQWQLHHGPFTTSDFDRELPWTLLVQAVDHYIPAVAELRKLIDFIPQWRVDDVMVSYAVDGGSVGPHFDNYDVFLLQGEGERLWKLGQFCDESTPLLPHDDLRILRDFECTAEYLLGPGDMLYVPPGIAHWGIAQGDCTTFSIGFRAPRINDMVSRWADQLLEQMQAPDFYRDARQEPVTRAGEIRPRDLERAMAQLQAALDQATGNHWFGELVTEPRYDLAELDCELNEALAALADSPEFVALSASAKLAWQHEAEGITVFANGESQTFDESVLPSLVILCESWRLAASDLEDARDDTNTYTLLEYLLQSGCLYVQ